MLRLNDDCLLEIFTKFPIYELINLTCVCKRFEAIVIEMIIRPRFGRYSLNLSTEDIRLSDLKLKEFKQFFKIMSRYIDVLHIQDTNSSAFSTYLERYAHRPSLEFFISLQYDSLSNFVCRDFKLNDSHMRQLTNSCKHLRKISLHSKYITGKHIESFRHLKTIEFVGCNIQKTPLQLIVAKLTLRSLELIDNITDVTKALADAEIETITSIEITDPNFGVYYAAKLSITNLVVYDLPENLVPEEEEPEEEEPVEGAPVEEQLVERHPAEGNPVEEQIVDGQPVEAEPVEEGHPVVGAPEEEQGGRVKRLRLYPHLTVWFVKRVRYIRAPRDYDIFESLTRIVTQLELPSTKPPNLNAVIAMVKACRKLEVLKLELNDYNCDNLEQLTDFCVRRHRVLRFYLQYRAGRRSKALNNIKMWRSNSSLYKSQSNFVLDFCEYTAPRARFLFNYKFA